MLQIAFSLTQMCRLKPSGKDCIGAPVHWQIKRCSLGGFRQLFLTYVVRGTFQLGYGHSKKAAVSTKCS